ncbi:hypothetical protein V5D56_09945 [Cellulosimicrobium sp. PMB13]|uniref:hypothetical protein n=1 Tax=Cellulosimicrobium sp. PMB13 TaxID=3120158 RepID=UPI003F4CA088
MGNPYAPPRPDAPQRPGPGDAPSSAPGAGARPPQPGPGAPPPPAPGPVPPPRPTPEPEPVDPESARLATRRVLHFGLLLLLVIVLSTLPFPWQMVSLAVAVAAIVAGVRALVATWRARVRGALVPALAIGVGLAVLLTFQLVGVLVTWDVAMEHQRCLDGAITVGAADRCETARLQAIESWVGGLVPQP